MNDTTTRRIVWRRAFNGTRLWALRLGLDRENALRLARDEARDALIEAGFVPLTRGRVPRGDADAAPMALGVAFSRAVEAALERGSGRLVELRGTLVELVARIDEKLRENDGRGMPGEKLRR
jgi:hypothetical protein